MRRIRVNSSSVASVGYEAKTRTLEIEFLNGRVYRYFEVPPEEHQALMNADSKGTHVNQCIIGAFEYSRHERRQQ